MTQRENSNGAKLSVLMYLVPTILFVLLTCSAIVQERSIISIGMRGTAAVVFFIGVMLTIAKTKKER